MSTEFRTANTDEWVCTRWCKGEAVRSGGQAFDFGSEPRFRLMESLVLDADLDLLGEDGTRTTLFELLVTGTSPALLGHRLVPTFGEFGGTVALGDGELMDRLGMTGLGEDGELSS
jgi:hypothetical protein